jgi:hypothetical protein
VCEGLDQSDKFFLWGCVWFGEGHAHHVTLENFDQRRDKREGQYEGAHLKLFIAGRDWIFLDPFFNLSPWVADLANN